MPKGSKPSRSSGGAAASRRESARNRAAALREAEAARQRRRRLLRWGGVCAAVVVIAAVIVIVVLSRNGNDAAPTTVASSALSGPAGPEGISLEQGNVLAPASAAATGATVDGIQCNSNEQVAYHIHAHLAIFINGSLRPVPGGVGIVRPVAQQTAQGPFYGATNCYYWLHTHTQDGIIHIEAPSQTTYTLGQFFAIWQQQLSSGQIGSTTGNVTAYVNGKAYAGDPASIPLKSHEDIQLDLGSPTVAPVTIDWSKSQL